jgi:predicted kinase
VDAGVGSPSARPSAHPWRGHPAEIACQDALSLRRVTGVTPRPTLFLTVGLPGVGKTTHAKQLAAAHGILRLTPDEWMAPLFGQSDAGGRRDILEGRLIWVAHEVLASGAGVVLDFGCWSAVERYAIRVIAESVGADFALEFVHVDEDERRRRASRRWLEAPDTTFEMTDADHDRFLAAIELPSQDELENGPVPPPPPGHASWPAWASARWPTLPDLSAPTPG